MGGAGITKKSLATARRKDNLRELEAIVFFLRNRLQAPLRGASEERQKGEAIMADDTNNDAQDNQQPPEPSPDLRSLDELVGTWEMSGEEYGRVSF